jgi:acyl carrier protein
MTDTEIKDAILDGLANLAPEADLAGLDPKANLRTTLDLDSFDFLRFLIALGEATGIEVPEADYAKLGTLDAMAAYFAKATRS